MDNAHYVVTVNDDKKKLLKNKNSLFTIKVNKDKESYKFDFFYTLCIVIPLGIASLVMGIYAPGSCDNTDITNITVAKYLIGIGISDLVVHIPSVFYLYFLMKNHNISLYSVNKLGCIALFYVMFTLCWFFIGAFVLFRSNKDCINEGSPHVIFALVMWILSLVDLVRCCCSSCTTTMEA